VAVSPLSHMADVSDDKGTTLEENEYEGHSRLNWTLLRDRSPVCMAIGNTKSVRYELSICPGDVTMLV
jgi:hypothetical protein